MVCVTLITKWTKQSWKCVYGTFAFVSPCPPNNWIHSQCMQYCMLSYLTIAIVAVSNKRPFGANSNTEGPAFKGAYSRSRRTIWGTSEAHYCTTIQSNRVISAHAHYHLGQAEAKSEAIFIDGYVTGRARVKFVYYVTFQDDSYKFRMAWSLDLVWRKEFCANIVSVVSFVYHLLPSGAHH